MNENSENLGKSRTFTEECWHTIFKSPAQNAIELPRLQRNGLNTVQQCSLFDSVQNEEFVKGVAATLPILLNESHLYSQGEILILDGLIVRITSR